MQVPVADVGTASMRPPGITGGIRSPQPPTRNHHAGFNEAAGYYRRNPGGPVLVEVTGVAGASMRPPGITGGIQLAQHGVPAGALTASMRPPGITGGIVRT